MALSATSVAQTTSKTITTGDYSVVPKCFAYGGSTTYLTTISEDGNAYVYNDEIELVKSFAVNRPEYSQVYEYQQRKPEVIVDKEEREKVQDYQTNQDWTGTWEQAKEYVSSYFGGTFEVKDNYQLWPARESDYWNYGTYGKQYPRTYYQWNSGDGTISIIDVEIFTAYTGDWETTSRSEYTYTSNEDFSFDDYDSGSYPDHEFFLSQTLFNTDDKFEYCVPVYESVQEITNETDQDGDGEIDHRTVSQKDVVVGLRVISEDGTVISTIDDFGTGYYSTSSNKIIKINGKIYLVKKIYSNGKGKSEGAVFYKIDNQASSITLAKALQTKSSAIYSVNGTVQPALQQGINIVRESDGNVSKILVK